MYQPTMYLVLKMIYYNSSLIHYRLATSSTYYRLANNVFTIIFNLQGDCLAPPVTTVGGGEQNKFNVLKVL